MQEFEWILLILIALHSVLQDIHKIIKTSRKRNKKR